MPANNALRPQAQAACSACRKRKSRCKLDDAGQLICLMCKLHATDCVFPGRGPDIPRGVAANRRDQKKTTRNTSIIVTSSTSSELHGHDSEQAPNAQSAFSTPEMHKNHAQEIPFSTSSAPDFGNADESHVIGPVQSPDAQLIADYLLNDLSVGPQASRLVTAHPGQFQTGQRPVLFNTVRRLPLGHVPAQTVAESKSKIIAKLIEPHGQHLVDVYFTQIHQCFPLLDKQSFILQYATEKDKISCVLLSSVYAQAIVYWRISMLTANQHVPDLRFIWDQANQALNSELYASPSISTISAILLNISGRPLTSMIGNGVLLSSAISLAHVLGLNRNCLDWNISSAEKCLRTRLWWAIVIYDKWSSVTHGTPPQLRTCQHDVPAPTNANLAGYCEEGHVKEAFPTFAAFATLSEVLDTYLDYVFNLRDLPGHRDDTISLVIEKRLSQWEDELPDELRRAVIRGTNLQIKGSANLRLAYLYILLLAQKLGIDSAKQNGYADTTALDHKMLQARQAAENIVLFVQELDDTALRDFWLSFNAFSLSGTVAFLFRGALETSKGLGHIAHSRHLKLARDMITSLQEHQRRMNWDLGNICIAQYADIIGKMTASDNQPLESIPELQQFCLTDFTEVDRLFPDLWEMFNGV